MSTSRPIVRRGGSVLGLCGGYQMLGKRIMDPEGVETEKGAVCEGLGLLDIETVMAGEKRTVQVTGSHLESGSPMHGYEIHVGRTEGPDRARPIFTIEGKEEGATSPDGRVMGSYIHGYSMMISSALLSLNLSAMRLRARVISLVSRRRLMRWQIISPSIWMSKG